MSDKIPVTVAIPVKNEESGLERCLARLSQFAEVVVVDSSSTDDTQQIARKYNATVVNFVWDGRYPKKRNWLLLNHRMACDWVLFLDADELVNNSFCEAVRTAVLSQRHNGYWLNYTNHFLGRPLHHGIAQRKLALFRVGKGLYERIEEMKWSALDMEVHEHPTIEGSVGEIRERIDHDDDRGVAKFIDRHREYAVWEVQRTRLLREQGRGASINLTRRQRFKYRHIDKWWYSYLYFVMQYFVKLGVLDGYAGLQYALFKSWYFSTIHLLYLQQLTLEGEARRTSKVVNDCRA